MTPRRLLLISLIFVINFCHAQEELPTMSSDVSGNTWGNVVTPLHKLSWDNGFGFESEVNGSQTATLKTTLVRYGIFEDMELRIGTSFLLWNNAQDTIPFQGMGPLTIGTKLIVYDGTNILPSIGLLAEFQSPHLGSKELLPSHLAPSLYLIFENEINDWFGICYNAGAAWDGETATPTTFLSFCLNLGITDALGTYVESFNYLHPENDNKYMIGWGLTWLASRRVQLYLSTDLDLQNLSKYYAITGGMAWLIN